MCPCPQQPQPPEQPPPRQHPGPALLAKGCTGTRCSCGWEGTPGTGCRRAGDTEKGAERLHQAGKCCVPSCRHVGTGSGLATTARRSQHSHRDTSHRQRALGHSCVLSAASHSTAAGRKGLKELPERGMRPGNSAADAGRRFAGEASLSRHSSVTVTAPLRRLGAPAVSRSSTRGAGDRLGCTRGADRGPARVTRTSPRTQPEPALPHRCGCKGDPWHSVLAVSHRCGAAPSRARRECGHRGALGRVCMC